MATDREFTRILDWPEYRVYQHEIDEKAKTLKLWIRRKRGNRRLECAGYLLKESLDRLWTYHYEGARFLVARDTDGNRVNFSSTYDEPKHTVNMTSARLKQAGEFTHSQPDAQHLILRGTLNGNPIVAAFHRLDESSLLLTTRGFHWINEDPFNR